MIRIFCVVGISLALALSSCNHQAKTLTKDQFPDTWPFKVESGSVECLDGFAVVFRTNGKVYALNDAARHSDEFENIKEILRPDANYPGGKIMRDLSDIEFEGLKLCDR